MSNVLNAVVSSAILVLVARYLDPSTYGKYAVILGTVQTVTVLLGSGVSAWAIREVAKNPESSEIVFVSVFKFLVGVGAIVVLTSVVALTALSMSTMVFAAALLLTCQSVIRSITESAMGMLMGRTRTSEVAKANIAETAVSLLLIPSSMLLGFGIVGLAAAELVATFARACLAFKGLKTLLPGRINFRNSRVRWVVKSSRPFWVSQSSFGVASRLQPVVIGVSTSYVAGLYAFGQRLFESSMFAITPIASVLVPHVTRSIAQRNAKIKSWLVIWSIAAIVGLAVAVALEIVARTALPRFVGSKYEDVYQHAWILGLAIVFLFAAQVLNSYLIALHLEKFLARSSAASSAVLLGLLFIAATLESLALCFAILCAWYAAINIFWGVRVYLGLRSLDEHIIEQPNLLIINPLAAPANTSVVTEKT